MCRPHHRQDHRTSKMPTTSPSDAWRWLSAQPTSSQCSPAPSRRVCHPTTLSILPASWIASASRRVPRLHHAARLFSRSPGMGPIRRTFERLVIAHLPIAESYTGSGLSCPRYASQGLVGTKGMLSTLRGMDGHPARRNGRVPGPRSVVHVSLLPHKTVYVFVYEVSPYDMNRPYFVRT